MIDNIPELPGIYYFWIKPLNKGYVGQTSNLLRRYKEHIQGKGNKTIEKFKLEDLSFQVLEVLENSSFSKRCAVEYKYKQLYGMSNLINKVHGDEFFLTKAKPVYVYDLEGNFIAKYESEIETSRKLGIEKSGVHYCCKNKFNNINGFITINSKSELPVRLAYIKNKPNQHLERARRVFGKAILQFSKDGKFIAKHAGIRQLKDSLGFAHSNIIKCAKGRQEYAYDYIWRYDVDNEWLLV